MVDTKVLLKASLEAGKDFLRAPTPAVLEPQAGQLTPLDDAKWGDPAGLMGDIEHVKTAPILVPIRSLGENHRERITQHLLTLDNADRYLRFGYTATDEHIRRYTQSLNFDRDEIFGVYNRKLELVAMAHLAYGGECFESCAEFGVSVLKESRGMGLGSHLFDRAAIHARNDGVHLMFIHALSENDVMLKIARKAGAVVEQIGSESEAYLRLLPPTLDSRLTEIVEEQVAQVDYRLKVQAKQFWAFWANVQARVHLH